MAATGTPPSSSASRIGSAAVSTNSTDTATCRSASTCAFTHSTVAAARISPAFCRNRSSAARPRAVSFFRRASCISARNSDHSASYCARSAGVRSTGVPVTETGPHGAGRCSVAGGSLSASQLRSRARSARRSPASSVHAQP